MIHPILFRILRLIATCSDCEFVYFCCYVLGHGHLVSILKPIGHVLISRNAFTYFPCWFKSKKVLDKAYLITFETTGY